MHDITDSEGGGGCEAITFTPDGRSLILITDRIYSKPGENIFVYRTENWQTEWALRTVPFQPQALSLSPDGKLMVISGYILDGGPMKHQISLIDISKRAIVRNIPTTRYGHILQMQLITVRIVYQ
jgi:Tol biopolymer transport system component